MAAPALTTWTVVYKMDRAACEAADKVLARYVNPGSDYVGLRERREDALERARLVSGQPVRRETHVLLKTTFSPAGFARYATLSTGTAHAFTPVLHKKVYSDTSHDWQVWHFQDDLPLAVVVDGQAFVTSEWVEIS